MTFSDDELRARFKALRDTEYEHAPGFHAVLDRPARPAADVSRTGRRWRSPLALSLAAAAVVVLAISLALRIPNKHEAFVQPLSVWTSPTASLLRTPGFALLESSTLAGSVLDGMTLSSAQTLGDKP